MKRWHSLMIGAIAIPAMWLLAMSLVSLFANGFFYHLDEYPVPVLSVREDVVLLRFSRTARTDIAATCAREIECDGRVFLMGERPCPIEKGHATFAAALPLPEEASGECIYRGIATYRPFGVLGPDLSYAWKSALFTVERGGETE